jgi:hypothetical protein
LLPVSSPVGPDEVPAFVVAWPAQAQAHFTEGPVWALSYHRIQPDKGDACLKWIRANSLPSMAEQKKQGLILDYKVFFNTGRREVTRKPLP